MTQTVFCGISAGGRGQKIAGIPSFSRSSARVFAALSVPASIAQE